MAGDDIQYSVKRGGRLPGGKAAVRIIGTELEVIDESLGGISAQSVVDRARTPGNPLHEWDTQYHYFEWDDTAAAEEYRRDQARSLIRTVKVIVESGDQRLSARGFYAVKDNGGAVYKPVGFVVSNADAHEQIIMRFQSEMVRLEQAYQAYMSYADFAMAFSGVFLEVNKVIDEMAAEGDPRAKQLVRQRYRRDSAGNIAIG